MWPTYYQGHDPKVSGTGFDSLSGLGFFSPMAWASPAAWLGSFSNKHQPRRSVTAAQQLTARPSCSGSGRSISVFKKGGREVACYLPHLRAHTHALASLQKREIGLWLLPFHSDAIAPDLCGMWPTYYQGHDPKVSGTGFDSLSGLGFFSPMAWASPAA